MEFEAGDNDPKATPCCANTALNRQFLLVLHLKYRLTALNGSVSPATNRKHIKKFLKTMALASLSTINNEADNRGPMHKKQPLLYVYLKIVYHIIMF